ncbi:MAG: hypothetical protein L3J59_10385 [Methylococcaceae bacterium]|nr:hypothetical protein [Methylococcaceae bacterium]
MPTKGQQKRLTNHYRKIAKSDVTIKVIHEIIYVFGSELSCLRLFHHYRMSMDKISFKYSKNRNSFFFSMEISDSSILSDK